MQRCCFLVFCFALLWWCTTSVAATQNTTINIAVASNFVRPMQQLIARFNTTHAPYVAVLITGSSGKHFAQINQGAPFDIFFAADTSYPQKLQQLGLAEQDHGFVYAIGKLALWRKTTTKNNPTQLDANWLKFAQFNHLAIANPQLAPYGKAAMQTLHSLQLGNQLTPKLVYGENINQALQFVASGAATTRFVAYSQLKWLQIPRHAYWLVPQNLYQPIAQAAVLLKRNAAAIAFMQFAQSMPAQKIVQNFGYDTTQ